MWWIFTDHIPDNWIAQFSLRNFALCDATEIFVLLAGYAAGIAYGRSYIRFGWLYAGADVMRRAWTLYVAHIFLFVVFAAQVSYSATALDRSDYLDEIHLDVLAEAPYRAMLEALLLSFQPAYLNILPMYVALLSFFALLLPLLSRPLILGGMSFSLYVATRAMGWNLPSWTDSGWYFNPLAWQLLFVIGALLSQHGSRLRLPRRTMDVAAASVVIVGVIVLWLVWPSDDLVARVPKIVTRALLMIDKEGLHPMRLLSILALTWLICRLIPFQAHWLRSRYAMPVILCGQHSLPVFCSGIFLSFLGRLAMEAEGGGWAIQLFVNLAGVLLLVGIGGMASWYRDKGRMRADLPPVSQPSNVKIT